MALSQQQHALLDSNSIKAQDSGIDTQAYVSIQRPADIAYSSEEYQQFMSKYLITLGPALLPEGHVYSTGLLTNENNPTDAAGPVSLGKSNK